MNFKGKHHGNAKSEAVKFNRQLLSLSSRKYSKKKPILFTGMPAINSKEYMMNRYFISMLYVLPKSLLTHLSSGNIYNSIVLPFPPPFFSPSQLINFFCIPLMLILVEPIGFLFAFLTVLTDWGLPLL